MKTKMREEFEKEYPNIPWTDNPTTLHTRQTAFCAGYTAALAEIEDKLYKILNDEINVGEVAQYFFEENLTKGENNDEKLETN